jgi:hypothetical protein
MDMPKDMIDSSRCRRLSPLTEVYVAGRMKRKKANTKAAKKKNAAPKPRNLMARALKESGLFKPKVVPAAKDDTYRRRTKHPKPFVPDEADE